MFGAEEAPTFYQTDYSLLGTCQLQALNECPLVASPKCHRERLPAQSASSFLLPGLAPQIRNSLEEKGSICHLFSSPI